MSALIAALLFLLKALGILLLVILALVLIALLIPVSTWIDYHDEALTVQVGALGLKYTVLPQKEKPNKKPKKKSQKKPKPKAAAKEKPKKALPKEKNQLMQLTFDQLVTVVKGLGAMGKRILNGLKVKHIRLYVPVTGEDAAETAIRYGKMQAWLHGGLGVLNRAIWLDFDECRLEADFLGKGEKNSRFSCQISAQMLIMGIAAARFVWLLWKADILDALLAQFSGNETKNKENNDG